MKGLKVLIKTAHNEYLSLINTRDLLKLLVVKITN